MPKKKDVAFDVPSEVRSATQSGWVYKSSPAATGHDVRTRARTAAPTPRRAREAPEDWFTRLVVTPFSLPLCLVLSLLPQTARRQHPN